ncbi:MAG: hypothetical protein KJO07_17380, partial [Deltaproteobacteria bacterium]|nr:hypothetical protein [Deltaproteobacteria bacterium]
LLPAERAIAIVTDQPAADDEAWLTGLERAAAVVVPSAQMARHPPANWRRILATARQLVGIPHGGRGPPAPTDGGEVRSILGLSQRGPLAVTRGPIDLGCTGSWERLPRTGVRLVAIADPEVARALAPVAEQMPRHLAIIGPDHRCAELARRAADIHVFAAEYRPAPESVLATAGGRLVVAHSSGEHVDRIVSWDPSSRTGNGLLFSPGELMSALIVAGREVDGPVLQAAARRLDSSWGPAARHYSRLANVVAKNWQR